MELGQRFRSLSCLIARSLRLELHLQTLALIRPLFQANQVLDGPEDAKELHPCESCMRPYDRNMRPYDRNMCTYDRNMCTYDRSMCPYDRNILSPHGDGPYPNKPFFPYLACLPTHICSTFSPRNIIQGVFFSRRYRSSRESHDEALKGHWASV